MECLEECVCCSSVVDTGEEDVYWCGGTPQVTWAALSTRTQLPFPVLTN